MIPILYEKDETAFVSNGLGRLRDAIQVLCSEERNGLYEVVFSYPMDGAHFEDIQVGRIIGVTHDDTGDIQPFDIVGYSKPIEGVVEFHCVHISYRQSYITLLPAITNDLSAALSLCKDYTDRGPNGNPFNYSTDMTKAGYCAGVSQLPQTVRAALGGVEGSILDTYGGEYEWDRWNVILHSARGQMRDFSIRYGVNMTDYEEEFDCQGCYSSCIPFWTNGELTVTGDKVSGANATVTGRGECVPLDLSDKFENLPTKAQVEAMALSYINSNRTYLPTKNIHVEFVRLQDSPEYEGIANLLQCRLCDTVQVIFPNYNSSGWFKIVKIEWNVLENRYESMELGDLSTTLAEALGIDFSGSTDAAKTTFVITDTYTLTSGVFAINDSRITADTAVFVQEMYTSALGVKSYHYTAQPLSGVANIYVRTASGSTPTGQVKVCVLFVNA